MMQRRWTQMVLPAYLLLCLFLGGSSSGGAAVNALLQLLSVAIIWYAASSRDGLVQGEYVGSSLLRGLLLLTGVWLIFQLIPMPGSLWTMLPGREAIADQMAMIGTAPGWRPLAIEWERTIGAVLTFLPPLAVLLLALRSDQSTIAWAIIWVMGGAVLASLIGAAQLAGGTESALYFYEITNTASSTGFFANSNHFSTLFNVLAALAFAATEPDPARKRGNGSLAWLGWLALGAFFLANTFLNRSLAGLALSALVAAYGLLFFFVRIKSRPQRIGVIAFLGVAVAGFASFIAFAPREMADRIFFQTTEISSRTYLWDGTMQAIGDTFPFGIGLGNFRWFFPRYEDPTITMANYANHAHNDWLEIALEGGFLAIFILLLLGILIIAAARRFLVGPIRQVLRISAPYVALLVIALHSFVDYPLRTATIATIASLLLAMIVRGLTFDPEITHSRQRTRRKNAVEHESS